MYLIRTIILAAFLLNSFGPIPRAQADVLALPELPKIQYPQSLAIVKGLTIHPDNPLQFDLIVQPNDNTRFPEAVLRDESLRLMKYFLASVTTPETDMWVNLSPYEKNRIIPDGFGQTLMGRDLLADDYILKQVTSAMIHPESQVGKEFWSKVYAQAQAKYGTTNVPINTFNKVWIMPDKATVWEHGQSVFVIERHLKVMLEEDYVAASKNTVGAGLAPAQDLKATARVARMDNQSVSSQIVRDIVIPALEKEVNEGETFAQLRQIYNAMILATWFKKRMKDSLVGQIYMDQNKTIGVGNGRDRSLQDVNKVYQQYLQTFKKGVFNFIKEEPDPVSGAMIPRKYFSGGAVGLRLADLAMINSSIERLPQAARDMLPSDKAMKVAFNLKSSLALRALTNSSIPNTSNRFDAAMTSNNPDQSAHTRRMMMLGDKLRAMPLMSSLFVNPGETDVLKALFGGRKVLNIAPEDHTHSMVLKPQNLMTALRSRGIEAWALSPAEPKAEWAQWYYRDIIEHMTQVADDSMDDVVTLQFFDPVYHPVDKKDFPLVAKELRRVLKDQGRLFIDDYHQEDSDLAYALIEAGFLRLIDVSTMTSVYINHKALIGADLTKKTLAAAVSPFEKTSPRPDQAMLLSLDQIKQAIDRKITGQQLADLWKAPGMMGYSYQESTDKDLIAAVWRAQYQQIYDQEIAQGSYTQDLERQIYAPIEKLNIASDGIEKFYINHASVSEQLTHLIRSLVKKDGAPGKLSIVLGGTLYEEVKGVIELVEASLKQVARENNLNDEQANKWIDHWDVSIRALSIQTAYLIATHHQMTKDQVAHRQWVSYEYMDLLDPWQQQRLAMNPVDVMFVVNSLYLGEWGYTPDGKKMPDFLMPDGKWFRTPVLDEWKKKKDFVVRVSEFVNPNGLFITESPRGQSKGFEDPPTYPGFIPQMAMGKEIGGSPLRWRTGVYVKQDLARSVDSALSQTRKKDVQDMAMTNSSHSSYMAGLLRNLMFEHPSLMVAPEEKDVFRKFLTGRRVLNIAPEDDTLSGILKSHNLMTDLRALGIEADALSPAVPKAEWSQHFIRARIQEMSAVPDSYYDDVFIVALFDPVYSFPQIQESQYPAIARGLKRVLKDKGRFFVDVEGGELLAKALNDEGFEALTHESQGHDHPVVFINHKSDAAMASYGSEDEFVNKFKWERNQTIASAVKDELPVAIKAFRTLLEIRQRMDTHGLRDKPLIVVQNLNLGELYPYFTNRMLQYLGFSKADLVSTDRLLDDKEYSTPDNKARFMMVKLRFSSYDFDGRERPAITASDKYGRRLMRLIDLSKRSGGTVVIIDNTPSKTFGHALGRIKEFFEKKSPNNFKTINRDESLSDDIQSSADAQIIVYNVNQTPAGEAFKASSFDDSLFYNQYVPVDEHAPQYKGERTVFIGGKRKNVFDVARDYYGRELEKSLAQEGLLPKEFLSEDAAMSSVDEETEAKNEPLKLDYRFLDSKAILQDPVLMDEIEKLGYLGMEDFLFHIKAAVLAYAKGELVGVYGMMGDGVSALGAGIVVGKDYRRNGIGWKILKAMIRELKKQGYQRFTLNFAIYPENDGKASIEASQGLARRLKEYVKLKEAIHVTGDLWGIESIDLKLDMIGDDEWSDDAAMTSATDDRLQFESKDDFANRYMISGISRNGMSPFPRLQKSVREIIDHEVPDAVRALKDILNIRRWLDDNGQGNRPVIIWQNMRLGELYPLMTPAFKEALGIKEVITSTRDLRAWAKDPTTIPEAYKKARYLLVQFKVPSIMPDHAESIRSFNEFATHLNAFTMMIDNSERSTSSAQWYAFVCALWFEREDYGKKVFDHYRPASENLEVLQEPVIWSFLNTGRASPSWMDDRDAFIEDTKERVNVAGEEHSAYELARGLYGEAIEKAVLESQDTVLNVIKPFLTKADAAMASGPLTLKYLTAEQTKQLKQSMINWGYFNQMSFYFRFDGAVAAYEGDELIGAMLLNLSDPQLAVGRGISIKESSRGRKIAIRMVIEALKQIKQQGRKALRMNFITDANKKEFATSQGLARQVLRTFEGHAQVDYDHWTKLGAQGINRIDHLVINVDGLDLERLNTGDPKDQDSTLELAAHADRAMPSDLGGIDMNSTNLELSIKRDEAGIPLASSLQNWSNIRIDGLEPVIIKIEPFDSASLFSYN